MKRPERIHIFVHEIWKWYARHKRDLPWRDLQIKDDTERAYQILVSEIMLQQTQVSRVKIVFKEFLSKFPKISDLAEASNRDVILAWRGMGYNNRAIRLRDAAREVESGKWKVDKELFPREMDALMEIPGVGHYTAAAIRNFAFNIPTPCIDTNIRRILHRTFVGPENANGTWKKDDQYLLSIASEILDEAVDTYEKSFVRLLVGSNKRTNEQTFSGAAAEWHAALMDFGSLVCTKRNPKWDVCPLTKAGIMKSAYKLPVISDQLSEKKKEPGRLVGSKFIPNRIFRGKIIEELRDAQKGMTVEQIGLQVCMDWNADKHQKWLEGIVEALKKDNLIVSRRGKLLLAE